MRGTHILVLVIAGQESDRAQHELSQISHRRLRGAGGMAFSSEILRLRLGIGANLGRGAPSSIVL